MQNFWQLTIPVILKKDLIFKNMNEELSKAINKAMLLSDDFKKFHETNVFKYYVFSGLYPVTKEGYKKGNMYSFTFRCLNRTFALQMKNFIKKSKNDLYDVVTVSIESREQFNINELYTVTPTIAVFTENNKKPKHWTKEEFSIEQLKERINSNTQKKYILWQDEEIDKTHNFIENIEQVNNKVIILNYKHPGKLFTNKFRIKVKQDKLSQKLAFMILGTGLLEKNSLGLGYCTIGK